MQFTTVTLPLVRSTWKITNSFAIFLRVDRLMNQYKQALDWAHSRFLPYIVDGRCGWCGPSAGPSQYPALTWDSSWHTDLFSLRKRMAKHLAPARAAGHGDSGRQQEVSEVWGQLQGLVKGCSKAFFSKGKTKGGIVSPVLPRVSP